VKQNTKTTGAMMAIAMSLAAATPSAAEPDRTPVKVGIMDLKADSLTYDASGVRIEYRTFTPQGAKEGRETQETSDDHGAVVASAFVRQYRGLDPKTPIEIYAANPFALVKKEGGGAGLRLDFKKGLEAIEWMHSKGVRVVVTAYNSSDQPGAKLFMDRAEALGMVVFAAYSNSRGAGSVFPAADYRAVSVVDTSNGMRGLNLVKGGGRDFDGAKAGVTFAMDGGVPQGAYGATVMLGSSFTSAKAAAYGLIALKAEPDLTRDQLVERIGVASRPHVVSRGGESLSLAYIGDAATDKRFLDAQRTIAMKGASKAPATEIATSAIDTRIVVNVR